MTKAAAAEDEGGARPAGDVDEVADLADAARREPGEQQDDERHAEDHGVDGGTSLAGPVDVLEVQDKGELVEREGSSRAEAQGEELDPGAARVQGELEDTEDDHADDAEHGVVDVQATRRDDAAGAGALATACPRDARVEARQHEREDEADQQEEQRPLGVVQNVPGERGGEKGEHHTPIIGAVRGPQPPVRAAAGTDLPQARRRRPSRGRHTDGLADAEGVADGDGLGDGRPSGSQSFSRSLSTAFARRCWPSTVKCTPSASRRSGT